MGSYRRTGEPAGKCQSKRHKPMNGEARPKVEKFPAGAEEVVVAKKSVKADGAKGGRVELQKRNQKWTVSHIFGKRRSKQGNQGAV